MRPGCRRGTHTASGFCHFLVPLVASHPAGPNSDPAPPHLPNVASFHCVMGCSSLLCFLHHHSAQSLPILRVLWQCHTEASSTAIGNSRLCQPKAATTRWGFIWVKVWKFGSEKFKVIINMFVVCVAVCVFGGCVGLASGIWHLAAGVWLAGCVAVCVVSLGWCWPHVH